MTRKQLPGGYVRLTPDEGKRIFHPASGQYYSEVVCLEKKSNQFIEVNHD